ncbi:MAG: ThiF family adenylyltransferase [Parabacteroides sp.]|nr:ThiF family adenylyltransferase [Parabacteroides sp.]
MKQETSTFIITQEWGEDVYSKLSWFKQKNVKFANVMVVGCGALGNEVIKNLALFGIEHLGPFLHIKIIFVKLVFNKMNKPAFLMKNCFE